MVEGKVVGAVGVSGVTSEQDAIVAQAGAGALADLDPSKGPHRRHEIHRMLGAG